MNQYDNIIKLIIAGESGVGKSCIVNMFCNNIYTDTEMATIGVDFKIKIIKLDEKKIKLHIWDTAGQERFKSVTVPYFRGVHGVLLVFDLTDHQTFEQLEKWLSEIEYYMADFNYKIILAGNKCDNEGLIKVTDLEIEAFTKKHGMEYIMTSAKKNINIEEAFELIVTNIVNSNINTINKWAPIKLAQDIKEKKNKCCY